MQGSSTICAQNCIAAYFEDAAADMQKQYTNDKSIGWASVKKLLRSTRGSKWSRIKMLPVLKDDQGVPAKTEQEVAEL
eukprot:4107825-Karenia_brevis.AAC.1